MSYMEHFFCWHNVTGQLLSRVCYKFLIRIIQDTNPPNTLVFNLDGCNSMDK